MIINDKILELCKELAIITDTTGNEVKALYEIQYKHNGIEINFYRERLTASIYCYYSDSSVVFSAGNIYLAPRTMVILSKLMLALEKQLKKDKEKEKEEIL